CYYIEPCIDLMRKEASFPWEAIDEKKLLIYCSLGTQSHLAGENKPLLQAIIDAIALEQNWQLVISLGAHLRTENFHPAPPNVCLAGTSPQLEMLKRASVMLTHGGINSVKESIFFGVPMIVFPMGRDQPGVAARVVYHGLGVRGNRSTASAKQI